jgi:hypothetical protein
MTLFPPDPSLEHVMQIHRQLGRQQRRLAHHLQWLAEDDPTRHCLSLQFAQTLQQFLVLDRYLTYLTEPLPLPQEARTRTE